MARTKVGARNITVDGTAYHWRASGSDGLISLSIWPADAGQRMIAASVGYGEKWGSAPCANGAYPLHVRQIVITNRVVRRVIQVARSEFGYDPKSDGTPLVLRRIDEQIDLSDAIRAE